jgi:hypothetical protein
MQPDYSYYHGFKPRDPEIASLGRRIQKQSEREKDKINHTGIKRPQSFGYPSSNQQPSFDYRSNNQRPDWMDPFGLKTEENVGKRQRQESDPEQERLRKERLKREQERLKREQEERLRREQEERLRREQEERLRREQEGLMQEQERNSEMSMNDADHNLLNKIHSYFKKKNPQNSQMSQLSIDNLKLLIYNTNDKNNTLAKMIRAEEPNIRKFSLILHSDKLRGLSNEFYSKIDELYKQWTGLYQDGGKKRTYRNKSNKKRKNTRSKKHLKKNKRKV